MSFTTTSLSFLLEEEAPHNPFSFEALLSDVDDFMALFPDANGTRSVVNSHSIEGSDHSPPSAPAPENEGTRTYDLMLEPTPIRPGAQVSIISNITPIIRWDQDELCNALRPLLQMEAQVEPKTCIMLQPQEYEERGVEEPFSCATTGQVAKPLLKRQLEAPPVIYSTKSQEDDVPLPERKKAKILHTEPQKILLPTDSQEEETAEMAETPVSATITVGSSKKKIKSKSPSEDSASPSSGRSTSRFRSYQSDLWHERFQDLQIFQRENGHCLVPHTYKISPSLVQWVKRQRHQYKLKNDGFHSTLTNERQEMLEKLDFVWDSHEAGWEERYRDLLRFKQKYGHVNVPTKYPENTALSIWVKCQRRQYKLKSDGRSKKTHITNERIERLEALGFIWKPRQQPNYNNDNVRQQQS